MCNLRSSLCDNITLYYQNVRGLRTKTRNFFYSSHVETYDFYCLTETWLSDNFLNSELFPKQYHVFREDNQPDVSNKTRGGGVLIAIHNKHSVISNASHFSTNLVNFLCVPVCVENRKYLVCVLYIAPNSNLNDYLKIFNFLSSLLDTQSSDTSVIITGDFNLPRFNNPDSQHLETYKQFESFCSTYHLQQYNSILNNNGKLLDLILSDFQIRVLRCREPLINEDNYHPSLILSFSSRFNHLTRASKTTNNIYKHNYRNADFSKLYSLLRKYDYSHMFTQCDVNLATSEFYNSVQFIMNESIPLKLNTFNNKFPCWFTKKLISSIKMKKKMYKKWMASKTISKFMFLGKKIKMLKQKIKKDIKRAYNNYAKLCEYQMKLNPKRFWSFYNLKRKQNNALQNYMTYKGKQSKSPSEIVNFFSSHFQNNFNHSDDNELEIFDTLVKKYPTHVIDSISDEEVCMAIKDLNPSPSCGPDLVPAFIIKGCANLWIKPLRFLFNLAIKTGTYPSKWKVSKVCPVLKKGDHCIIENYRPVSILCSFSKIFEIILNKRLYNYVESNISPFQHGFIPKRSTVTNLTCLMNYTSEALHNNSQVDIIYFDFKSAFDTVPHGLLLLKLLNLNIPYYLLLLLRSYLTGRSMYVSFNGVTSYQFNVTSSVPQGSVLGPILFILFINDVPDFVKYSNILLYADDLKLYRIIKDFEDCHKLQNDIDNLFSWALFNKLSYNVQKCTLMRFGNVRVQNNYNLNGILLNSCHVVRDLGVYFDSRLNFQEHISKKINDANKILSLLIRTSHEFTNLETLKILYVSLVRSHLEYASTVWNTEKKNLILKIERVQKRFLRYLYFKKTKIYPHYKNHPVRTFELENIFKMINLQSRRNINDCIFVLKILKNKIDCPELLNRICLRVNFKNTRNVEPFISRNIHGSPLNRGVIQLNDFYKKNVDFDLFFMNYMEARRKLIGM